MNNIESRVKSTLATYLGEVASDMKPDTKLIDDLGADSLDMVEIAMWMEDEFEIDIPDSAVDKMTTVQAVIDYITQRIGA